MNEPHIGARWAGAQESTFLRKIFDALPGAVGYWDSGLYCRYANKAFFDWFGKRPEAVLGTHYRDLVNEEFYAANEPYFRDALAGSEVSYERNVMRPDGSLRNLFVNYIPDFDADGSVAGFFVQVNDVTQIKQAEAQLEVGAAVFEYAADGIMVTDANGTILSVNPAFSEITGYAAAEAVGQNPRMLKSGRQDAEFYAAMWDQLKKCNRWQGEIWNRRKNGETFIERQTIRMIRSATDGTVRYVSVFSDITEHWRKSEHVRHLAFHDELTDLPNRTTFVDRLSVEIAASERDARRLAVMFIDLDGFKNVNDQLGHDAGDALLKLVASKLQALIRRTDMVARIGGDEFVALLPNVQTDEPAARVARKMIEAINEPLTLHGKMAKVGVSIGVAMYPRDGSCADDLLRAADAAMYDVKASGKNSFGFARGTRVQSEARTSGIEFRLP